MSAVVLIASDGSVSGRSYGGQVAAASPHFDATDCSRGRPDRAFMAGTHVRREFPDGLCAGDPHIFSQAGQSHELGPVCGDRVSRHSDADRDLVCSGVHFRVVGTTPGRGRSFRARLALSIDHGAFLSAHDSSRGDCGVSARCDARPRTFPSLLHRLPSLHPSAARACVRMFGPLPGRKGPPSTVDPARDGDLGLRPRQEPRAESAGRCAGFGVDDAEAGRSIGALGFWELGRLTWHDRSPTSHDRHSGASRVAGSAKNQDEQHGDTVARQPDTAAGRRG